MTTEAHQTGSTDEREALVEKLLADTLASMETFSVYLGLRLGLYAALDAGGAATPGQLAAWAGVDQRYAREWLEQQAVAGILRVDDTAHAADCRAYALPGGHREVLLDEGSPVYAGPLTYFLGSVAKVLPDLLDAYCTGRGVPFADYGPDLRDHVAGLNRVMFTNDLATRWMPTVPDLHRRLSSDPPARVADIACGCGWSSIALATAYPKITVHGVDLDEASVAEAREHAAQAGVGARVTFAVADAADPGLEGPYDAAFLFEALHDLARPVEVLRSVRGLLADVGALIVADERVADAFTAPGDQIERLMYGFSILHCLPAGRAETPSAATGTVLRPATVRRYAHEAGFGSVDVLPIDNDLWRFYRLNP
jgi:2-polyprenyl-3-methyl-5-hydroxy-6-metoxy-1,4-benzoquinol methylase